MDTKPSLLSADQKQAVVAVWDKCNPQYFSLSSDVLSFFEEALAKVQAVEHVGDVQWSARELRTQRAMRYLGQPDSRSLYTAFLHLQSEMDWEYATKIADLEKQVGDLQEALARATYVGRHRVIDFNFAEAVNLKSSKTIETLKEVARAIQAGEIDTLEAAGLSVFKDIDLSTYFTEPVTDEPVPPEQPDQLNVATLVDRFLTWPLPQSVNSDKCVTDNTYTFPRSGTNLLSAIEAEEMVRHVLGDLIKQVPDSSAPVHLLKKAIQADPEYAWTWHCTLSILIKDSLGISLYKANKAGAALMKGLFDVNIRENSAWKHDVLDSDEPDALEVLVKALGYPWLPCPICQGTEGCDHPVPERARAALAKQAPVQTSAGSGAEITKEQVEDLIIETERAINQRDVFSKTGISTALRGGSHDTCFGAILRRHFRKNGWSSIFDGGIYSLTDTPRVIPEQWSTPPKKYYSAHDTTETAKLPPQDTPTTTTQVTRQAIIEESINLVKGLQNSVVYNDKDRGYNKAIGHVVERLQVQRDDYPGVLTPATASTSSSSALEEARRIGLKRISKFAKATADGNLETVVLPTDTLALLLQANLDDIPATDDLKLVGARERIAAYLDTSKKLKHADTIAYIADVVALYPAMEASRAHSGTPLQSTDK
jgi:hypothetical protein